MDVEGLGGCERAHATRLPIPKRTRAVGDEQRGEPVRVRPTSVARLPSPPRHASATTVHVLPARRSGDGFPPTRPLWRTSGATSGPTSPASAAARGAAK